MTCPHGSSAEGCAPCALRKAAHECDLITYEAMGLMLSMLDMGLMPVAMLAIANKLQSRFTEAQRTLNALGARTPIVSANNPGSNKQCRP